jgi:hypothetical protein
LKRAITEREADAEYVSEQRVETLRQQRIDERDSGLEAIQASRIKVLRKLSMARGRLQPPSSAPPYALSTSSLKGGRDVISEYATYSSRVYAPIIRDGQRPDKVTSSRSAGYDLFSTSRSDSDMGSESHYWPIYVFLSLVRHIGEK